MWLKAPNIDLVHGFSTRHGGVSTGPFSSLNLGGSVDKQENVSRNRHLALQALGLNQQALFTLKQVHGNTVCETGPSGPEGDALVSNKKKETIAVLAADCYPLLLADKKNAVIGAAHCGWRGILKGVASNTVKKMIGLGAEATEIRVAIGPGISQKNFVVGNEVISAFMSAGFPSSAIVHDRIDLAACILYNLYSVGILAENSWSMRRCTFEDDFFSYRRDQGQTGRMMGLISL